MAFPQQKPASTPPVIYGETAADRVKRLSEALLNAPYKPAGYDAQLAQAREARAYHHLEPYPIYQFQHWKTEDRGPLPKCLPLPRTIVRKGAKWLFGKPLQIVCQENSQLEQFLRRAWQKNRMHTRMVAAAEQAGYEGGIALKFSYDETAKPDLQFEVLSVIDNVRLYLDPVDSDRILMARVQYPYVSSVDGCTYIYREEWTDDLFVEYEPERVGSTRNNGGAYTSYVVGSGGDASDPDVYTGWREVARRENPFGIIPIHLIRNVESTSDAPYGAGDLWRVFRILDRVNLTYHGMDRSNQLDSTPIPVFIDAAIEADESDRVVEPGGAISVKSENAAEGAKAQVQLMEPSGKLRDSVREYARDLIKMILDCVGCVIADQAEITNKGNLTQAVLTQLYAPLVESTDEKRKTYGEDGVCKFLERVTIGLSNFGRVKDLPKISPDDEDSYSVSLMWSDYFTATDDEMSARVDRVRREESCGYITRERAVQMVAAMEKIEDIPTLLEEIAAEREQVALDQSQNLHTDGNQNRGLDRGDSGDPESQTADQH